ATLHALKDFIVVDTPFNVNCLENILYFHLNELFVSSVIHGLCNGFWPLDLGEWEDSLYNQTKNYATDPQDINKIQAFHDYEIVARYEFTLLQGMKVSSMFMVWQNRKSHIVMDHTFSGLNAGISASEAKVKYNNMHPFSETFYNAKLQHPNADFTLYKSDVAKAFLNLPVHPLW
ncbi:uncharacterized protein BT62DRAFT_901108, partial [Guyanagaster necrorhizus]